MDNLQKAYADKAKRSNAAVSLRMADGGQVQGPGTGTSDSVPIQGSAGEYMLPADTVQAIGVDNLNALKDATHADVGLRAPGMYANGGLIDPNDPLQQVQSKTPSLRQVGPGLTQDPATGTFNQEPLQNPGRELARPAPIPTTPATNVPTGGVPSTAQDLRSFERPTAVPPSTPAPAAAAVDAAPAVAEAATPAASGLAESAGRTVGNLARTAAPLLRTAALTAPVYGFGDYKINDPGVDSSASGVIGNALRGNFAGAGAGLRQGAVEAGLDSISGIAKTGDALAGVVGLHPGLAQAFDGKVRGDIGNQLVPNAPAASKGAASLRTQDPSQVSSDPTIAQPAPASQAGAASTAEPALSPNNVNQNVANFQQQYGAAAQRAGDKLGVDPKLLLAQWGNETGWGKSVIPGTNNLGNIKDFSGGGVGARDNATGSTDKYRQFSSPEDFADNYASLISRKYPGAVGAGSDPTKFTTGLAGYAQDPQYGNKVAAAYGMLNGVPASNVAAAQAQAAASNPYPTLRNNLSPQASFTNQKNIGEDGFNRDGTVQMISGVNRNGEYAGSNANFNYTPDAIQNQENVASLRNFSAPGDKVQAEIENARALRDQAATDRQRQALQFGVTAAREQGAQDRANAADQQKRIQDGSNQLQKDLEARNTITGPNGAPTFDANQVGQQRQYLDAAMGELSKHGAQSYADLNPHEKEQLLAGSKLLSKIAPDATSWPIPWKPDALGTSNPLNLVGMKRLPNGDAQTRDGKVIPARYINKKNADRIGGEPTDEFNSLFAKGQ